MDDIYAYIVFEKVAAPAWKKMLDAGRIGAEELSRMLPHTPVPGNYHGVPEAAALPKLLPKVRAALQAPGQELSGEALARYRDLSARRAAQKVTNAGGVLANKPGVGAASLRGVPYVSPQAGTTIRGFDSKKAPERGLAGTVMLSGQDLPEAIYKHVAKPVDKSLFSSVAHHELAEAASQRAAAHGGYKPSPVASHMGTAPYLAENLGHRDAEALSLMRRLRATTGTDDPAMYAKLKQHGMVGNYTPPLGGRAHRSLEHQAARLPVLEGGMNRGMLGMRIEFTPNAERNIQRVGSVYDRMKGHLPDAVRAPLDRVHAGWQQFRTVNAAKPYSFSRDNPEQVQMLLRNFTSV